VVSYRSGREKKMYSVTRSILAVAVLFISSLCGTVAFPQAAKFIHHAADPWPLANMTLSRVPCTRERESAAADSNAATAASRGPDSACDTPPVSAPSVNPCSPAGLGRSGCPAPRDAVQEDLAGMGKAGQKILRARERVLEILQGENTCSAWYRGKDSNPADTFRTLSFEMDPKGQELVLESKRTGDLTIFRSPYVARVFQGDGRYGRITINTNGAFFSPLATMVEEQSDGGARSLRGTRLLRVGPYAGDTLHAQVLALLHEFGHIVDLLPTDEGDLDGKSEQNTAEVLRFCRAEVESKVRRNTLSATR